VSIQEPAVDPVVATFRDEITALDVRLVGTVNARVNAVAALAHYKRERGIPLIDPEREAALVAHLKRVNVGPLSDDGLEELLAFVLALAKREAVHV